MPEQFYPQTRREMIAMHFRENGYATCRDCGEGCEWWLSRKGRRILMNFMRDDDPHAKAVPHQETCIGKRKA